MNQWAMIIWLLAVGAQAQSVPVTFTYDGTPIAGRFAGDPQGKQIAEWNAAAAIVKALAGASQYWNFQVDLTASSNRLVSHLCIHGATRYDFVIDRVGNGPTETIMQVELLGESEVNTWGVPPTADLPDKIGQLVRDYFRSNVDRVIKKMASFPISQEFQVTMPLRLVLPLEWKRYCGLAGSSFLIDAGLHTEHVIVLSKGTRTSSKWPHPPFPAVEVAVSKINGQPPTAAQYNQLQQKTPKLVWLGSYDELGDPCALGAIVP